MPLNPSQPIHFGSVAGGGRWPHGPATTGSVAGSVRRHARGVRRLHLAGQVLSPERPRSRRTDSAFRSLDCRRSSASASASGVAAALHFEQHGLREEARLVGQVRTRDCTRYELTLNARISPASRKNVITSSAGTTPTKTYERISLRRTRHSSRRFAHTAKRVSAVGDGKQQREAADHVDGFERTTAA